MAALAVAQTPPQPKVWKSFAEFTGKFVVLQILLSPDKSPLKTTVLKIQAANFPFPLVYKMIDLRYNYFQKPISADFLPMEGYGLRFKGKDKLAQMVGVILRNPATKQDYVVEDYESYADPSNVGAIMIGTLLQFVDGTDLFEAIIKRGRFEGQAAVDLSIKVLEAVQTLHQTRVLETPDKAEDGIVVHRDLKPENFLAKPNGDIALTDFGMVKEVTETPRRHSLCGSPHYTAPEIHARLPYNDSADRFSCGGVIYCIASGSLFMDEGNDGLSTLRIFFLLFAASKKSAKQLRDLHEILNTPGKFGQAKLDFPELADFLTQAEKDVRLKQQIKKFSDHIRDVTKSMGIIEKEEPRLAAVIDGLLHSVPDQRWTLQRAIDTLKNPWEEPVCDPEWSV